MIQYGDLLGDDYLLYTTYPINRGDVEGTDDKETDIREIDNIASSLFNVDFITACYNVSKYGIFRCSRSYKSKPFLLKELTFKVERMVLLPTGRSSTLLLLDSNFKLHLMSNINNSRRKDKVSVLKTIEFWAPLLCITPCFYGQCNPGKELYYCTAEIAFIALVRLSDGKMQLSKLTFDSKMVKILKTDVIAFTPQSHEGINDFCLADEGFIFAKKSGIYAFAIDEMSKDSPKKYFEKKLYNGSYSRIAVTSKNEIFAISEKNLADPKLRTLIKSSGSSTDGTFYTASTTEVRSLSSIGESIVLIDGLSIRILSRGDKLKHFLSLLKRTGQLFGYIEINQSKDITLTESVTLFMPSLQKDWAEVETQFSTSARREGMTIIIYYLLIFIARLRCNNRSTYHLLLTNYCMYVFLLIRIFTTIYI